MGGWGGLGGRGGSRRGRLVPLDEALRARIQDSKFCLTERGQLGPRPKEEGDLARSPGKGRAEAEVLHSSHCPPEKQLSEAVGHEVKSFPSPDLPPWPGS